jgi:GDP-4-dehydro-6-deoxy-D-mannose reductase
LTDVLAAVDGRAVLVTGATGFVGGHVVDLLCRAGAVVTAVSRAGGSNSGVAATQVSSFVAGDVSDGRFVHEVVHSSAPEVVVHLAASMTPGSDMGDGFGGFGPTVRSTAWFVDALATLRPTARLVVLSSSAVYGDSGPAPVSETAPVRPLTDYGVSKAAQELVALRARWAGELDVVVLRAFNAIGPGLPRDRVLGEVARQLVEARASPAAIAIGNLHPRRDFIDVRDVAAALAAVAASERVPPVLNVASGSSHSVEDVVERLIRLSGRSAHIVEATDRRRDREISDQVGDASLLAEVTGWSPQHGLDASLADLLADVKASSGGRAE